jgi:hypothetical protein
MNTVDLLRTLEDEFYEPALCAGTLRFGDRTEAVEVLSLSAHSADLRCSDEIAEDGPVTLAIDGFREFTGELVRRHGHIIGMMFEVAEQRGTRITRPVTAQAIEPTEPAAPKRQTSRAMREHARSAVFWSGAVRGGRENVECVVLNMSPGGAKIRLLKRFTGDGSPVILHVDRLGGYTCEVIWTEGNTMGLRFLRDPKQIANEIEQGLRKAPKQS